MHDYCSQAKHIKAIWSNTAMVASQSLSPHMPVSSVSAKHILINCLVLLLDSVYRLFCVLVQSKPPFWCASSVNAVKLFMQEPAGAAAGMHALGATAKQLL